MNGVVDSQHELHTHPGERPTRSIEEAERAYKEALLSFGASGLKLKEIPESLIQAGKEYIDAMKNVGGAERTLAREALSQHAKMTVETKLSKVFKIKAVVTELLNKDPRTVRFKGKSEFTSKISVKFLRWLSPGNIVDAIVAVKERHDDLNWPGKDYKKIEEVNVELGRRWPQIQKLSSRPKTKFGELKDEDNEWLRRADGEYDDDVPRRSIEEAEAAYKESLLSFGGTRKRLKDIPDSLKEGGKDYIQAMKNVVEVERTLAREALLQHAKFTVITNQSDMNQLKDVFSELLRKDPRTSYLKWTSNHTRKISLKFFRWLSPGDILDAVVAVKEEHADPNWPGSDYKKVGEEFNVELRKRWPQIQNMSGRPKTKFVELEEEEEDEEELSESDEVNVEVSESREENGEWSEQEDVGELDDPKISIEEAERAYKEALWAYGETGKGPKGISSRLIQIGKEYIEGMNNATEVEKTPARIALSQHAKITVETKQSDVNQLKALFNELLRKDPRVFQFEWKSQYQKIIHERFFRWLSPGEIVDTLVMVAVKEKHNDPNWPGRDLTQLEELNVELGRRWQNQNSKYTLKCTPKRLRGLNEERNDDEEEPAPQKKPQRKRERLSGKKNSDNSRDYSPFVMVYLDEAIVRLGKKPEE
jgi:hypothetical protein